MTESHRDRLTAVTAKVAAAYGDAVGDGVVCRPHDPEAAEHLVGLVDTTIVQLGSLPGAKLVRRRMTRAAGGREPDALTRVRGSL